jgi:hypothetical protein
MVAHKTFPLFVILIITGIEREINDKCPAINGRPGIQVRFSNLSHKGDREQLRYYFVRDTRTTAFMENPI